MPAALEPATRTGRLLRALRDHRLAAGLVGSDAVPKWPLPVRLPTKVLFVSVPFVPDPGPKGAGPAPLFPPVAVVTAPWPQPGQEPAPVECATLTLRALWADLPKDGPIGTALPPAVAGWTTGQYTAARDELYGLYDEMFDAMSAGRNLRPALLPRFRELFATLVEPGLVPYYRRLQPKFMDSVLGENDAAAAVGPSSPAADRPGDPLRSDPRQ
jgi:hypothetical protein